MKRHVARLSLLFVVCGLANAVVVDRIAMVVSNHVIKESDIERDIRITDFLNGDKLDLSPAARRKAAQRLIDQAMIRREFDQGRYTAPSPAETGQFLEQVKKQRFHNDAEFQQALRTYGITQQELESHVRWQINVLHFIEQRFRPGVLVSEQEVDAYYRAHQAEFRNAKTGKVASVDDVSEQIQDIIAAPKVNKEFEDWLDRARKRIKVDYREPSLE